MPADLETTVAVLAARDRELEDWGGFDYPHHWADLAPALLDPARRDEAVSLLEENDRVVEETLGYTYPARWVDIAPVLFSEKWESAVALLEYRDRSIESFTAGVDA